MFKIKDIFKEFLPEADMPFIKIEMSSRLMPYNAQIRYKTSFNKKIKEIEFILSNKWKNVDENIVKGLIHYLLNKVYKLNKKTIEIELYDNFMKHLHISIPKNKCDSVLFESFIRIKEKYFDNLIERPNLVWGKSNKHILGVYNFHKDEIKISSILKDAPPELLDYVVFHEILHKKFKFYATKTGKRIYHSPEFKRFEKKFEVKDIEKKLEEYLKNKKV